MSKIDYYDIDNEMKKEMKFDKDAVTVKSGGLEELDIVRYLLEDEYIPPELRKILVGIFSRTSALSNLTEKDIKFMKELAHAIFTLVEMSVPDYKISFEEAAKLMSMELWITPHFRRGFEGFERRMSATTIQLKRLEMAQETPQKRSFLSRLWGK